MKYRTGCDSYLKDNDRDVVQVAKVRSSFSYTSLRKRKLNEVKSNAGRGKRMSDDLCSSVFHLKNITTNRCMVDQKAYDS